MAPATPITFADFERLSATSGRAIEFWHGKVIEKPVPTWLHSLLQRLLSELLIQADYMAGPGVDLRVSREFAPRPDVMATREVIETRYPTQASEVEIIIEVLSPDDKRPEVEQKCREYAGLGVAQVFVADPETQQAWVWNRGLEQLDPTETWTLTNDRTIVLADVWRELQRWHRRRS